MLPLRFLHVWWRQLRRPSARRNRQLRRAWSRAHLHDRLAGFTDERTKNIAGMRKGTSLWRRG